MERPLVLHSRASPPCCCLAHLLTAPALPCPQTSSLAEPEEEPEGPPKAVEGSTEGAAAEEKKEEEPAAEVEVTEEEVKVEL